MAMNKYFFALLSLSFFFLSNSNAVGQTQYAFKINFVDKKGTKGDLASPSTFLSAKSLARRAKHSLVPDSSDLPVSAIYTDSVLKVTEGILHTKSRWQNNCVLLLYDSSKMNLVRSCSFVKSVQYVGIYLSPLHAMIALPEGEKKPLEIFPELSKTTGTIAYYGDAYDQIKLANGDYLHDRGFRGNGKLIAVIDEGFYLVNTLPGYDSLRLSGRITDTYNFNLDTDYVYAYSAHGTEVLSTMAGIMTGTYVGTAPDASYALYITENSGSEQPIEMDNLVAAMERADSAGADVITISLGYNTFNIGTLNADLSLTDIDGKSTVAARAANTATQKGILVVASAGNEGGTSWAKILTPGDADSALTCGSVDINKLRSPTSGKGPNAAGVRKPDVCMLGAPGIVLNNSGTTSSVSGTSIATPQLAGLAACLWQANPSATPYKLRKAIRESAHIASSPDDLLGFGVPDFGKADLSIDSVPDNVSAVTVMPNPFSDLITIKLPQGNTTDIQWIILNIQGQKLLSGSIANTTRFNIPIPGNFPSGVYFLQLVNGSTNSFSKIQKL